MVFSFVVVVVFQLCGFNSKFGFNEMKLLWSLVKFILVSPTSQKWIEYFGSYCLIGVVQKTRNHVEYVRAEHFPWNILLAIFAGS